MLVSTYLGKQRRNWAIVQINRVNNYMLISTEEDHLFVEFNRGIFILYYYLLIILIIINQLITIMLVI